VACKECRKKQAHELYLQHKKDLLENDRPKILHKKAPLLRKACTKCNIEKDIKEFPYDGPRDCYGNMCTSCRIKNRGRRLVKPSKNLQIKLDLFAQGKRQCTKCGEIMLLSNFARKHNPPTALCDYFAICRKCISHLYNEPYASKNRMQKNMKDIIGFINTEFICELCGKTKPPYEMGIVNARFCRCKECQLIQKRKEYARKNQNVKNNPYRHMVAHMRKCLKDSLVGRKGHKTFVYLGCTGLELKVWLESQFTNGMSWENRGIDGWHIDHYVPISYFDLSQEEDRFICWNYRNLRPLWSAENVEKGNSLPDDYLQHIEKIKKELHFPFDNPQTT
jgi:hypothetical protein